MNGPEATPEVAGWRYALAALLPLFVALPAGFFLSAVMVHASLLLRGLEPWNLDPAALMAAFGPLELSLGGLGNQLAFLALVWPALRHVDSRALVLGDVVTTSRPHSVFVLSAVGMYALASALAIVVSLLGLDHEGTLGQLNDVMARLGLLERLSLLPVLAIVAGFAEELFFRGLLFRRLIGVLSPARTVWLTALAFGFAHMDPVHSLAALVMGLYLGWLRLRTGSAWPGIVAHVFSNGMVVISHRWLDDVSDVPGFGLAGAMLIFGLAVWSVRRRL